jgi:hypothetical protein
MAAQRYFAEDNQMVQTLASNRTDDPLDERIRPREFATGRFYAEMEF